MLRLVAVDVVLLVTWTLVDRPRRIYTVEVISSGLGEYKVEIGFNILRDAPLK